MREFIKMNLYRTDVIVVIALLNFGVITESIFQTLGQRTFQPYGPNMCDNLCERYKDCSDLLFDEVQLICELVVTVGNTSLFETTSRKSDETSQKANGKICPAADEDFINKCDSNLDEVKRLVSQGLVDVNCKGNYEETCVMQAVRTHNSAIFDFLVQHGCDLSAVDEDNSTVLHHACIGGNMYVIKKLVDDYKSDIHWRDGDGYTPLFYAKHVPVFKFLKDRGDDFQTVDKKNNTILHQACEEGLLEVVTYIISLNIIDLETKGEHGKTPLMAAVEENEKRIVDFLLTRGASLTSADDFGNNVLHIACLAGEEAMIKYLMTLKELKGFVKNKNKSGNTPMQLCNE